MSVACNNTLVAKSQKGLNKRMDLSIEDSWIKMLLWFKIACWDKACSSLGLLFELLLGWRWGLWWRELNRWCSGLGRGGFVCEKRLGMRRRSACSRGKVQVHGWRWEIEIRKRCCVQGDFNSEYLLYTRVYVSRMILGAYVHDGIRSKNAIDKETPHG